MAVARYKLHDVVTAGILPVNFDALPEIPVMR